MGPLNNEKARRGTPGSLHQSATEDQHKCTSASGLTAVISRHPWLLAYLSVVALAVVLVGVTS